MDALQKLASELRLTIEIQQDGRLFIDNPCCGWQEHLSRDEVIDVAKDLLTLAEQMKAKDA